jgi:hypothetical protein
MADRTAILEGFDNAPPLDTGAPIELQFAVSLGGVSADAWLELNGSVRLHDYAAHQVDVFGRAVDASMRADETFDSRRLAMSKQAFAAGLMGRVQQHLLAALGITRDSRATH